MQFFNQSRTTIILTALAMLSLSGCSGILSGGIGGAATSVEGQINGIAASLDQFKAQRILDEKITIHNLQWEMWQVDQTQGPVMTVPTIGGVSTPPVTVAPMPAPSPIPGPTPSPTPTPIGPPANLP